MRVEGGMGGRVGMRVAMEVVEGKREVVEGRVGGGWW